MGQTMAEKLFSRKNKTGEKVKAGDYIDALVDGIMLELPFPQVHDHMLKAGIKGGLSKVWDKDRVYYIMDHFQPAPNVKISEENRVGRELALKLGLTHFHESTPSISHQVMCEEGYVLPGELVPGNDSHSTMYGAMNAGGTGMGEADLAYALTFGELWFQVPHSIKIELKGKAKSYPFAKDVMLHLAGKYGDDFGQYKALEFCGPVVSDMPVSDRMCLSVQSVELAAKFGFFPADDKLKEFLEPRAKRPYEPLVADSDAEYVSTIEVDVDKLDFYVAKPHSIGNVATVDEVAGTKIVQAVLGSCANGRYEDILVAAKLLKGKKIPHHIRFLVSPASWQVYRKCIVDGLIVDLIDAGAQILEPGCGCCQPMKGYLSPGEVCITSTTRNFKGRLGSPESFVYLAGPATIVASALKGEITNPKELLSEHYPR